MEGNPFAQSFAQSFAHHLVETSRDPRARHQRWLEDWQHSRRSRVELTLEKEERKNTCRADSWRGRRSRARALGAWRDALHQSWADRQRALTFWRMFSMHRSVRQWKATVDRQKARAEAAVRAWEHRQRKVASAVFNSMRALAAARRQERERLVQTAVARNLILKCRWRLLDWCDFVARSRADRQKQEVLALGRGLRRWAKAARRARRERAKLQGASAFARRTLALKTFEKWVAAARQTTRDRAAETRGDNIYIKKCLARWQARAKDVRSLRETTASQNQCAMLFWYHRRMQMGLAAWYNLTLEAQMEAQRAASAIVFRVEK